MSLVSSQLVACNKSRVSDNRFAIRVIHYKASRAAPVKKRWAYAFVMVDNDHHTATPEKAMFERAGQWYHILVSVHMLQSHNTQADFIVLTPMKLTKLEKVAFDALGIDVKMVTSDSVVPHDFIKLAILDLVDYTSVMYLGGLPYCNLDYLFALIDEGHFKENVIFAGPGSPAMPHLFLLRPVAGVWQQFQQWIKEIIHCNSDHPYNIDAIYGWGAEMRTPWIDCKGMQAGNFWTWHNAASDSGLLYYYTKFLRQSVTIDIGAGHLEHVEQNKVMVINATSIPYYQRRSCLPMGMGMSGKYAFPGPRILKRIPFRDVYLWQWFEEDTPLPHGIEDEFSFTKPPWQTFKRPPPYVETMDQAQNAHELWSFLLAHLQDKLAPTKIDLRLEALERQVQLLSEGDF